MMILEESLQFWFISSRIREAFMYPWLLTCPVSLQISHSHMSAQHTRFFLQSSSATGPPDWTRRNQDLPRNNTSSCSVRNNRSFHGLKNSWTCLAAGSFPCSFRPAASRGLLLLRNVENMSRTVTGCSHTGPRTGAWKDAWTPDRLQPRSGNRRRNAEGTKATETVRKTVTRAGIVPGKRSGKCVSVRSPEVLEGEWEPTQVRVGLSACWKSFSRN